MTVAIDRDELVTENKKLVHFVANKFRHLINSSFDYDDLVQVGYIGLLKAIEKFDESKGSKFSTFAVNTISFEIINFLRDYRQHIRIPAYLHPILTAIKRNEFKNLTVDEIAKKYNCSRKVAECCLIALNRNVTSLESKVFSHSEDSETNTLSNEFEVNDDFTAIIVEDFLSSLNERERQLIQEKIFGGTNLEIAERMGIESRRYYKIRNKIKQKFYHYSTT